MNAVIQPPPKSRVVTVVPVRIAFAIDNLGRAGTEMQLLALLKHIDRHEIEPTLILLDGTTPTSRELEPKDVPILRLGVTKLLSTKTAQATQQLRRWFHEHRTELLQAYFLDSAYFTIPVAKLAGVKRVVHVRNNLGYWLTPKHRLMHKMIAPCVDRVLTNSNAGREAFLKAGQREAKITVLENGVDHERFSGGVPPFTRSGPIHIGTVANLRTVKNIDGFLRAARRVVELHPQVKFSVAGDGPERASLEKLRDDLKLQDVFIFQGLVSHIPDYLNSLDLFVLPSHSEGMSNALLEAMAAGRAIIATDVGANRHLLTHEKHGIIVPPRDDDALAAAMIMCLTEPSRSVLYGTAASRRVVQDYSRASMCQAYVRFARELTRRSDQTTDH